MTSKGKAASGGLIDATVGVRRRVQRTYPSGDRHSPIGLETVREYAVRVTLAVGGRSAPRGPPGSTAVGRTMMLQLKSSRYQDRQ